ncbi:MAG TPA: cation:proton antiporter [Actinomycetes bacterium]|jgi:Kef-type K+ transport system membrane component KefB|nr:cation:proton antiporter [Actinomycetes bacterium]
MPELSLAGVVVVAAVAFAVPLLLGLLPGLRLPSVVLEIVAGIVLGPSVLGWVQVDLPVQVLSLLGLAFLLFLAGLEIDLRRLRGKLLGLVAFGFAVSFAIGLAVSGALAAVGLVDTPLLVAIILTATSLGVVIPALKDAGQVASEFGQLVIAAASIADFGAVILLSLFFSREASGPGAQLLLIGGLVLLAALVGLGLAGAGRSARLSEDLGRLQDSSAQIRVRGAVLLLALLVWVAQRLGLEVILGAFLAGALLRVVDRDEMMTHPRFRMKLEALGYGFLVPVFFVVSGVRFNLAALTGNPTTLYLLPLFLATLLVVRGLPAWLYRSRVGTRRSVVAGLLQATSLPFIVAAAQIGMELGKLDEATGAALVAAGLLSVLLFPLAALTILRGAGKELDGRVGSEAESTSVTS